MQYLKTLRKVAEAVNTWYGFAAILYAIILFSLSHTWLFLWFAGLTLPIVTAICGYFLNSYIANRTERYGFRVISDVMSYEIGSNHTYTLRYTTRLKAREDHLMTYPIGYQWSGDGMASIPKVTTPGQQLLVPASTKGKQARALPTGYKVTDSSDGEWRYSFVTISPPVHKGSEVTVKYSQDFIDKKRAARPILYYFVRLPMKRLELNVKFPAKQKPKSVTASYIKPGDPSKPYLTTGAEYNEDTGWANWVIHSPKKGYCYRISWEV